MYSNKNTKKGFTLAEVLITLGIIGVVAALTIPALMHKTANKELETGFKKTYANVCNAYAKAVHENGDALDLTNSSADRDLFYSQFSIISQGIPTGYNTGFMDKTLSGHSDYNFFQNNGAGRATYILKDGSMLGMFSSNGGVSGDGKIIVDTNGTKLPNRHGYDVFTYAISGDKIVPQGYVGLGNINYWQGCAPVSLGGANDGWSNGTNCTVFALYNKCPWDSTKTYWQCLP